MAKTGRNDPCHCGSGKKYKKCHLQEDEQARAKEAAATGGVELPPERPSEPEHDPFARLRPYARMRMMAATPNAQRLRKRDRERWTRLTPEGVASLETEEIVHRLADLGVDASPEAFLAAAEGHTSAWDVSTDWLEGRPWSQRPPLVEDFAGLAACELWKRFCPERASAEMLIDWMEEGYQIAEEDPARTCDLWWKVWEGLRPRLTPEMRRARDAEETFGAEQLLYNWTQDFSMALLDAARGDARYAEMGLGYLQQLVEQFPDEDGLYRFNARADQAEHLFRLGRADEGERALLELIREAPDRAGGYCRLADEWMATDPKRALALLEEARDYPVQDGEDWDLAVRLDTVREKVEALESEAEGSRA